MSAETPPKSVTATSSPSTSPAATNTPALGAELNKVDLRQGRNLWVTTKAIDGLSERITAARRELDKVGQPPERGEAGPGAGAGAEAGAEAGAGAGAGHEGLRKALLDLAKDCEGLKALDSVGSEHKNYHATISKLAKAAEKVQKRCVVLRFLGLMVVVKLEAAR